MSDSPMAEEEEMLAALGLGFLGTILVGIASVIVVQLVRLVRWIRSARSEVDLPDGNRPALSP
jgi:hypothetical protein